MTTIFCAGMANDAMSQDLLWKMHHRLDAETRKTQGIFGAW
jgi:hypothetical protein